MPQIYSAAELTIAWLGPSYENSSKAIQVLKKTSLSRWTAKRLLKLWSSPIGAAIRALCFRPYWTRLWIVQELVLAKDIEVRYGNEIVPCDRFGDFLDKVKCGATPIRTQDKFDYETVRSNPAMSIFVQTDSLLRERTLFQLLDTTKRQECAETRDRIYALLGIAFHGHADIEADYAMPIPALLNTVLWNQHEIMRPNSILEIERQCEQLTALFGLGVYAILELENEPEQPEPQEGDVFQHLDDDWGVEMVLRWTSFYDHEAVQDLLFEEDILGNYSLCVAAENGSLAIVMFLLDTGRIDVNSGAYHGDTALQRAAIRGHLPIVETLLTTGGADVNRTNDQKATALHEAAKKGQAEVAKFLINTGNADLTLKDAYGHTALYNAVTSGHDEVVKVLLETRQIDLNSSQDDISLYTALHVAVQRGHEGILKLLLDIGMLDVNIKDRFGSTALHHGIRRGYEGIVKLLLNAGEIDVNARQIDDEQTPLHIAAIKGSERLIKLLLEGRHVDINSMDSLYSTRLHHAVANGHERVVKLLLGTGVVDMDIRDRDGSTALQLAVDDKHQGVLRLLLDNGFTNEAKFKQCGG